MCTTAVCTCGITVPINVYVITVRTYVYTYMCTRIQLLYVLVELLYVYTCVEYTVRMSGIAVMYVVN